jgi:hypothetical protein
MDGVPFNDLMGRMFFERRKLVTDFCRVLPLLKLRFHQYSVDARDLPATLKLNHMNQTFDRIDVSNIADHIHLGIKATLAIVGPMLKSRSENPYATLLTYLMCCSRFVDNLPDQSKSKSHSPPHRKQYLKQFLTSWDEKIPHGTKAKIYMECIK